jgi:hypothetical protein
LADGVCPNLGANDSLSHPVVQKQAFWKRWLRILKFPQKLIFLCYPIKRAGWLIILAPPKNKASAWN